MRVIENCLYKELDRGGNKYFRLEAEKTMRKWEEIKYQQAYNSVLSKLPKWKRFLIRLIING